MAKFKVRPGMTFGFDNRYIEGDVVELSEGEALPFADKLTPVTNKEEGSAPEAAQDLIPIVEEQLEPDTFEGLNERVVELLIENNITEAMLSELSDAELRSYPGIGQGSVYKIRQLYPEN